MGSIPAYKAPETGHLTDQMLADFESAGVLILEDYVPTSECRRLRGRVLELIEAFDPQSVRRIGRATRLNSSHVRTSRMPSSA